MRFRHLSFLLLCLLFSGTLLHAGTFIVTSNADSGPGSLREAINQANANGTGVTDNIHFNIANVSAAGRTIILQDELPPLTSNIIIDGSTQPGTVFGVSQSKICLKVDAPKSFTFQMLRFDVVTNIEIYGLYFFNEVVTVFSTLQPINGIKFSKSSNVKIGMPGKGNYFRGLIYAINSSNNLADGLTNPNSNHVTIQSNLFNSDELGDPSILYPGNPQGFINPMDYAINFFNVVNILIGGDTDAEGNTFAARNIYIRSYLTSGNGYLTVKNNHISSRPDGSPYPGPAPYASLDIWGDYVNTPSDYDINIIDNEINGSILLSYQHEYFKIQGNTIYCFNSNGTWNSADYNSKIHIQSCLGGGLIGGETIELQNNIYVSSPILNPYGFTNIGFGSILISGSPNVEFIRNRTSCTGYYGSTIQVFNSGEPVIQIDHTETNLVRGKATPNCRIQVFKDDDCWACDGVAYLGETVSNADSSWSFSGNFTGVVIATATNGTHSTSNYTEPTYHASDVKIVLPSCGLPNGSIKGIVLMKTTDNVEWHTTFHRNGQYIDSIVSTDLELENMPAGQYYFVAKLGESCHSAITYFNLYDLSPSIYEANVTLQQPSCGRANGAINNLQVMNGEYSVYTLVNEIFTVIREGYWGSTPQFVDLLPGKYRLIVRDTIAGCADTSSLFDLVNQSGPELLTSNAQITAATCDNPNGKITGITAINYQGSPYIEWRDSLNNIVGNQLNLINQPAGKYLLKYKDQGGCDTIITPYYIIPSSGKITIDTTGKLITAAGCTIANGSIRNISVTGADSWHWENAATNANVGSSIDITGLTTGDYHLVTSNVQGCQVTSPLISILQTTFASIIPQDVRLEDPSCGLPTGHFTVTGFFNYAAVQSIRWIDDATAQTIGTSNSITGLGAGLYKLLATDTNGCEQVIYTQALVQHARPSFDLGSVHVEEDHCNQSIGKIEGVRWNDLYAPQSYTWIDANNTVVGNSQTLLNVPKGEYRLVLDDWENCIVTTTPITLGNSDDLDDSPIYDDLIIVRNSSASLQVKNPRAGTYSLYTDASGTMLIDRNTSGIFSLGVVDADRQLYVRLEAGTCRSSMVPVKVTVVDKSFFAIAKAFTPNHDGRNDRLLLNVIGYIEVEYFQIYNRNGELIFTTRTINDGWDGRYKGKEQPTGVFVWMARGKDISGKMVSSKGTFVLIR